MFFFVELGCFFLVELGCFEVSFIGDDTSVSISAEGRCRERTRDPDHNHCRNSHRTRQAGPSDTQALIKQKRPI